MSKHIIKPAPLAYITADNHDAEVPQLHADNAAIRGEYLPYEDVTPRPSRPIFTLSPAKVVPVVAVAGTMGVIGYVVVSVGIAMLLKVAGIAALLTFICAMILEPKRNRHVTMREGWSSCGTSNDATPNANVNIIVNQTGDKNRSNINVNL